MFLTDEICDKLCMAAKEKSKKIGIEGIQTNDPKITLVAGGYPLFVNEKIVGGIGVGGGTEKQDCEIAEYVLSVFKQLTA